MFFKSNARPDSKAAIREKDAGLAAFASESDPEPAVAARQTPVGASKSAGTFLKWTAVVLFSSTVAAAGTWHYKKLAPGAAHLSVETPVPGHAVLVAGKPVGRTPVGVELKPGSYQVQVGEGSSRRELTVTLTAGASVVRHVDLGTPDGSQVAGTQAAHLRVETDVAGSAVVVDGVDRGASPVTVEGLSAGTHEVAIRAAGATLDHKVTLRAGERTVVVFAAPRKPEAPATSVSAGSGGWLTVGTTIPVEIREAGRVVGSSSFERQMLPVGQHTLDFVNEALGYATRKTVRVEAGKTAVVQLERVNGVLSVNATPWAEVWIGDERIGQTPIGNLSRPIGTYDVILRHPQLGERRERVTITAKSPARLGVDLRKK